MNKELNYRSHVERIGETKVTLSINTYIGGGISIELERLVDGELSSLCSVTKFITGDIEPYQAYIDTNNSPNMEKFIKKNKLGKPTGKVISSGYCIYSLYQFNRERLLEVCPEGIEKYERKPILLEFNSLLNNCTDMVSVEVDRYYESRNLLLCLTILDANNIPELYEYITTDLGEVPALHGYLATDSLPGISDFIEKNGIGTFTGQTKNWEAWDYPLYQFDIDKLKELCPDDVSLLESLLNESKKDEKREVLEQSNTPMLFEYNNPFGGKDMLSLTKNQYADNGNLYIGLEIDEGDGTEPYADLTVNLGEVPEFYGYLDVNNLSDAENFVTKNGIATFTGQVKQSGFVTYPLYKFNNKRLKEIFSDDIKLLMVECSDSVIPCDGKKHNKTSSYTWYRVDNENELSVLAMSIGKSIEVKSYPEFICLEKSSNKEIKLTTLSECKCYMDEFISNFVY